MPALNSSPADHLLIFTITTTAYPPQTQKHDITSSKTARYVEELGLEPCLIPDLRFSPLLSASPEREEEETSPGDGMDTPLLVELEGRDQSQDSDVQLVKEKGI